MNTILIDPKGNATLLAAEGSYAIGCGYTTVAAQKYAEAGKELERNLAAARKAPDRHLLRFLAASQYYHGGHYQRAFNLSKHIEARFLSPGTRELLPKFLKDVQERSSPNYKERMRKSLSQLWFAKENEKVLNVLKDHQFIYEQEMLAFIRAVICEELGQWKAAAVFYLMAIHCILDGSFSMLIAVGYALRLHLVNRSEEAWDYINQLQELFPNTVTNTITSIICFLRASKATGEDRSNLHRDQLRYFEEGWREYQALPADRQNHPEIRETMSSAFNYALLALIRLGDDGHARVMVEQAIRFNPNDPGPFTVRGILNFPAEEAVKDFQKAADLPNAGHAPHLYLAHHAFHKGQFAEAERLSKVALTMNLNNVVRAQTLGWLAVFRDCLDAPKQEVESLIKQAFDADPGNELVAAIDMIFKKPVPSTNINGTKRWNLDPIRKPVDPDIISWDTSRISGANRNARVRDVLFAGAM